MTDSPNPFAAFLYQPDSVAIQSVVGKRPREEQADCATKSSKLVSSLPEAASTVAASLVHASLQKTAVGTSTAACTASTREQRLVELELIAAFREVTRASVDDFHAFLISLGTGGETDIGSPVHGRFWALVACLLSVQCRDHVALSATRALLRRCAGGGAASVAALSDDELDDCIRSCNFCKTKAKNVRAAAAHAVRHGGRVPEDYDALL